MDVTATVDRPPAFDIPFTVVASVSGSGPEYATRMYSRHLICMFLLDSDSVLCLHLIISLSEMMKSVVRIY